MNARVRSIAPWLIVVLFSGLGFAPTAAPDPAGSDAPESEFSAARAMEHVEVIAAEPHPMGSAAIERVRSYLVEQVTAFGLEVDQQHVMADDVYGGGGTIEIVNVIAWIPGTDNTGAVTLVAHYDTVPWTFGANDNSVPVAALLETARALQAGPELRNDILFVFTDAEEPEGRRGARAFASTPGLTDALGLVVNFEAGGGSGASLLAETSGPESWLMSEYAAAASSPAAFSYATELTRMIGPLGTDFDVFVEAGVPGYHFAYTRGSPIYHTEADNTDNVGKASLQHHGEHALGIARHFGDLDLSDSPEGGNAVFFTIGPVLVRYGAGWGLALAVVAAGALVAAAVLGRSRRPSLGRVTRSAGWLTLSGMASALTGTVAWMMLVQARSTPGVVESYVYGLGVLGLALAVAAFLTRRRSPVDGNWAIVALWFVLTVVTAIWLPGFGYLFAWPALAGALALLWRARTDGQALLRFTAVAAPTLVLMTPAVDLLFLFSQPRPGNTDSEVTFVVFLPLLLGLLVVRLLAVVWPTSDEQPIRETPATAIR